MQETLAFAASPRVARILPKQQSLSIPVRRWHPVFVFDATGRHLQTLDAFTNATLYEFAYDSAGRLSSVADVHGDVTRVNRDASGNPVGITGPLGQTTSLTTDANGYLASVTDPANQTTQFTYNGNGLMASMTDARGGLHQFAYDSTGS